jgi:hypothetical protein
MPEVSPRTQARFARGLDIISQYGVTAERREKIMAEAARPNGSMNFAKFLQLTEDAAREVLAKGAAADPSDKLGDDDGHRD